jgi:TRAP-type C4-dicarboxylate transport system permease large subunit
VVAGMVREVPMYTVFRGIFPFFIAMVVCIALIVVFPKIALFLPDSMMK